MNTPQTRRENEVWQACDELWALHASFKSLTGDGIRERLQALGYKKGSPNEVYKYRRTWQQSRGVKNELEFHGDEIENNDPISRAVSLVYEQLHAQSQSELSKLGEERSLLQENLAKLQTETELLKAQLTGLEQTHAQTEQALKQAQELLFTQQERFEFEQRIYAKQGHEREQEAERWRALSRDWSEQLMALKTENRLLTEQSEAALKRERVQRTIDNTKRANRIRTLELKCATLKQALKDSKEKKHVAHLTTPKAGKQSKAKRTRRKQPLQK